MRTDRLEQNLEFSRARLSRLIFALSAAIALSSCGAETPQEAAALDRAADASVVPLKSCTWETVDPMRVRYLSHSDQIDVCETMKLALQHPAPAGLARKMSNLAALIQTAGSKDSAREITYQTMNVVEARGQLDDDKAIGTSLDTVYKIFSFTQGHVTPRDLSIMLRSAGASARMNDDGLVRMAILLWEEKKATGG